MPKFLENILAKGAARRGLKGKAADRYIYGAMNRMGAMRGSKITAKGRAMERKHERDKGSAHRALSARYPDL